MQNEFINRIKGLLPENISLIDTISEILDISYDSAYRRANNKTSLTLEEGVILAKHFKISLNKLYEVGSRNTILTEKSPTIKTLQDLENYFLISHESIKPLVKMKNAEIIYSAKDIPIFYTLGDTLLTKYKFYVWLKFLNEDGSMAKMSFEEFIPLIPPSLVKCAIDLSDRYNYINITEFWNDNTINGTLQQLIYYYEAGLLNKESALSICKDLHNIIDHIEQQTIDQIIINSKNNASYHLFKSDLLTMSNTVMIKTKQKKLFFTPFTVLSYLKIEHQNTCNTLDLFFEKQMKNSKLLVNAGEKDRTLFFNKMRQKTDTLIKLIHINQDHISL